MKKFMQNFNISRFFGSFLPARSFTLARKEIYQFLHTPSVYGAVIFFLVFCSAWLFYFQQFFAKDQASMRFYFSAFPIVFVLVIPVLTMKSWAEERKTGTMELLLTMPYTEWDLVLGKFLSLLCAFTVMLLLTVPLPLSLLMFGRFEFGVLFCEYFGAFLLGACAIALGLLLSSLAKSQAGSFLGTAVVLLFVMLINQITARFNMPYWLASFINFFSLGHHFESFCKGIIDSRNLLFFVLTGSLFLYLNTRVILFRKWK